MCSDLGNAARRLSFLFPIEKAQEILRATHTRACTYFVSVIEAFKPKLFEKGASRILVTLGAQLRAGEAVTSLLAVCLEHGTIWKAQP